MCVFSREGRVRYLWTWLRGWRSSSAPTWVTSAWEEQSKSLKMAKSVCGAVSDWIIWGMCWCQKTFNYKRFLKWIKQNRELCAEMLGVVNFGLCCREFWWRQTWRARSEWSATCRAAQVRQRAATQVVSVVQSAGPVHSHTSDTWCVWNCGPGISNAKEKMKHRMFSSELEDLKSVDARRPLSSWRLILLV